MYTHTSIQIGSFRSVLNQIYANWLKKKQFLQKIAYNKYNMLENIMQYWWIFFINSRPQRRTQMKASKIWWRSHSRNLWVHPPPPKRKKFNTITLFCISCNYEALSNFFLTLSIREVLHMSLILYKVTGFFLLMLINFRQYNSVAGVPFRF